MTISLNRMLSQDPVEALNELLVWEDDAETQWLAPDERLTCPLHRTWIHQCAASPAHVNSVTLHRWCRRCAKPMPVSVDELDQTVVIRCLLCGDGSSPATTRLITSCRASIVLARRPGADTH